MRSPFQTRFAAIFHNEVLLNAKRIAPYALMILFSANAVLWWGWGPAVRLGWATNSEYYIVRNLQGFSFILGLPIFNAVIMGDAVIRDFRLGIDPLIFSKPVNRAEYLLGKFFGNFFVLVCCQSAFVLTLIGLQAFRTSQMVVQPVRVLPYFKHFFFFLVISHLILAAFYFTVGTLTRNAKIVYGLAVCFYPIYIAYQVVLLKGLPQRWKILLDPLLLNSGPSGNGFLNSADFLNRLVVSYSSDMIANRALVIIGTLACLGILYLRFEIVTRSETVEKFSVLNLSNVRERIYFDSDSFQETRDAGFESEEYGPREKAIVPSVSRSNHGFRINLSKLLAALGVEFRLLRAERSLIVLMPLAIFLSIFDLAFYQVVPEVSYSATYASGTAKVLLLFLVGMTVFYTGEAMHRDREVRIEPVLWSTPASNSVLLLSKFLATVLLALSLLVLVGVTAIVIQIIRGHAAIEIQPFLITYSVILLPSLLFLTALSVALNVVLRNKYLVYMISIGTAAGLFYLYSIGYNHWLYNPLLYQLWNYADLTGAGNQHARIFMQRLYCLGLASACLSLAHLFCPRKSTTGLITGGRLNGNGWSLLITFASVAIAVVAGSMIVA